MDYSTIEINFLGVTVTKVCNKLQTNLYCQPEDTNQHLHAQEFVQKKKNLLTMLNNEYSF